MDFCEESSAPDLAIDLGKLRAGESQEFEKMYGKYVHRVYGYALKISSSREDAEELTQEIFYRLWQQRQNVRSERLIWVITRHRCIDYLRATRPPVVTVDSDTLSTQAVPAEKQSMSAEDRQAVLQKLSSGEREVLALLLEGKSRQEIQQILNLPLGTIDSRLHRLKHKLQGDADYGY